MAGPNSALRQDRGFCATEKRLSQGDGVPPLRPRASPEKQRQQEQQERTEREKEKRKALLENMPHENKGNPTPFQLYKIRALKFFSK